MALFRTHKTGRNGLTSDRRATSASVIALGKTGTTSQSFAHREAGFHNGPPAPAERVLRQPQTPDFLQHAMPQAVSSSWSDGRLNDASSERIRTNADAAARVLANTKEKRTAALCRNVQLWGVPSRISSLAQLSMTCDHGLRLPTMCQTAGKISSSGLCSLARETAIVDSHDDLLFSLDVFSGRDVGQSHFGRRS
jgi:hypothetical protein